MSITISGAGITSAQLATDAIDGTHVADDAINSEHIAAGGVDNAHLATGIDATKLTGTIADARFPATLPAISGANLTNVAPTKSTVEALGIDVPAANLTGTVADARFPSTLPAASAANLTAIPAANVTGTLPASVLDTTVLENNIAMLGFFRASDNSKAKYSLVDQVIDEYTDATGIDAGASTNEVLASGVYKGQSAASGNSSSGTLTTHGSYAVNTFLSSSTFDAGTAGVTVDILVVGGGGGGGIGMGGGGGGGAVLTYTSQSLSAGTHTVTVAAGGTSGSTNFSRGTNGASSQFASLAAAIGGGGGGAYNNQTGLNGANGGGGGGKEGNGSEFVSPGTGTGSGRSGGYGVQRRNGNYGGAGGGGGYGTNGGDGVHEGRGGHGGNGITNDYRTGSAVYYGGGGGGANYSSYIGGTGGDGGGGDGHMGSGGATTQPGTANTGGGGGGGFETYTGQGNGGTGIVVVRYTANALTVLSADNLTLQSVANTAESAPATGDMVTLIEDAAGTATINTDIKGYISRNGGTTFTQGTLVDEGDWGTNKRILAFHNLDISGQSSGTSMKYKITTHNQSASKETRIHATSMAWA